MMIHVMRDGQQYGPYTLEDLNAYLAQGSLLVTDQAWYEGLQNWIPMEQVPGVYLPGMAQAQPVAVEVAPEPVADASPVVAVAEGGFSAGLVTALAGKKKILVIGGSGIGVVVLAGVILFARPDLPKDDGGEEPSAPQASSQTGGNEGGETFAKVVEPIFRKHRCFECHHSKESGKSAKADLDFSIPSSTRAFTSPNQEGNPATAPLILAITPGAAEPMPPSGAMIPRAEVSKIIKWIADGAKF